MNSETHALLGAGTFFLGGVMTAAGPSTTGSRAQMIAKAWLDDGYRESLLAQGIDVPARPDDIADEELDTSARASRAVPCKSDSFAVPCKSDSFAVPCKSDSFAVPCKSDSFAVPCKSDTWAYPCDRSLWATPSTCRH